MKPIIQGGFTMYQANDGEIFSTMTEAILHELEEAMANFNKVFSETQDVMEKTKAELESLR